MLSVTIAGPDLATADAYATAAFAMGAAGPRLDGDLAGPYEAFTILADESALVTDGFPATKPGRRLDRGVPPQAP